VFLGIFNVLRESLVVTDTVNPDTRCKPELNQEFSLLLTCPNACPDACMPSFRNNSSSLEIVLVLAKTHLSSLRLHYCQFISARLVQQSISMTQFREELTHSHSSRIFCTSRGVWRNGTTVVHAVVNVLFWKMLLRW
jgi:hypothetical protein